MTKTAHFTVSATLKAVWDEKYKEWRIQYVFIDLPRTDATAMATIPVKNIPEDALNVLFDYVNNVKTYKGD